MEKLSYVQLFATPWTVAYQALQSMGFSRQEYWSGLSLPSLIGSLWYILNLTYLLFCLCYWVPLLLLLLLSRFSCV